MKTINPDDLIPFNAFTDNHPIIVDVAYAQKDHPDNMFGQLYPKGTETMWGHKDLVLLTLMAAHICHHHYGWRLKMMDCYRPVEAQRRMQKFNVHPSLLSKPGIGGHPRGMAIDIVPIDADDGTLIDMGTSFDHFTPDPETHNPAARNFKDLPAEAIENRVKLEGAMLRAAQICGQEILPLPHEWWDFRFPAHIVREYAPINEGDLHDFQRVYTTTKNANFHSKSGRYTDKIIENIKDTHDKINAHTHLFLEKPPHSA